MHLQQYRGLGRVWSHMAVQNVQRDLQLFPRDWANWIFHSRERVAEFWRSQQGTDILSEFFSFLHLMLSVIHYDILVGAYTWARTALLSSCQSSNLCAFPSWWRLPLTLDGGGTPNQGVGKSWGRMTNFYSWSSAIAWTNSFERLRFLIMATQASNNLRTLETESSKKTWSMKVFTKLNINDNVKSMILQVRSRTDKKHCRCSPRIWFFSADDWQEAPSPILRLLCKLEKPLNVVLYLVVCVLRS